MREKIEMYAKINSNTLVKFPYTWEDLLKENPYTKYDNRFDLAGWYIQTEEAAATGNTVVEVHIQQDPIYDMKTQTIVQRIPELVSGVWTVGYDVIEKTEVNTPPEQILVPEGI